MRLKEKYQKEVIPKMMEKFHYKNRLAVPSIKKVIINTGFGKLLSEKKSGQEKEVIEEILRDLSLISGQKPILTSAKKSISAFKVREGQIIGAKVTLRKKRMWDFLEKVINVALPRVRDFQGISQKSLDQKGNLTIGFKEQTIFPEVKPEEVKHIFGLEASVVIEARKREEGLELLRLLGFPIRSD